jgi:hypothetical protein
MTIEELNSEMQILDIKIRQEKNPTKRDSLMKNKQVLGLRVEIEKIKKRIAQLS